ncbi:MAG: protein kinase [Proteobacteria bacterium]|jgi:serine/threonine-protein kinase|nr:protein kinase [Pseudomonadota bacterium]
MSETFGNYELIEKVAVGGMAEIFRAVSVHGQGVQKAVCIKRIHPALSSDGVFVAMFIEEARLGVSMVHGNIVPVFDFGYVDGHYYLAMEWVDGLDLATLCGRARIVGIDWPPELAMHVVVEVLEGLAYAHQKRDDQGRPLELVHRDVSPSNILVSLDGQVKLLDFGIARSEAREWKTSTGVVKGKPGYMSPEQACGGEVDARADVWSCGAVLYELLSGVRLRDGRRPLADPVLDAIVRRAIDAIPKNRYGSARELQAELTAVLDARRNQPRARDLAAFIDRVRSAAATGTNWDMKSSAVEQHLAAALEAANRDAADPPTRNDDQPATVRLAEDEVAEDELASARTVLVDAGARPKPRLRPWILGLAALAALAVAAGAWLLLFAPDDPSATTVTATPPPAVPAVADAGARAVPTPPAPDGGALDDAGPRPPEATPDEPPRPKGDRARTAPAVPRKALLSVNSSPWSNIVLDGREIGATPIPIDKPRQIPPGRHVLVLTNPVSGATRTVVFTVAAGDHKIVSEKL